MGENRDNMRLAMKELLGLVGFGPDESKSKSESKAAESARPVASEPVAEATTTTRTATVERPVVEEQPKVEREQEPVVEKPAVAASTDMEETRRKIASTVEHSFFGFGGHKEKEKVTPDFAEVKEETVPETEPYFINWETEEEPKTPPFIRPGATVIAAGATFFGDIRAEGDVEVLGKLKGNLEATGNIRVIGKVLGDVKGDAVILEGCTVQGNITSTSGLTLNETAMVVGDVLAADLDTKGKIKGNLQIARAANFGATALLAGNVIAATIVMAQGARVQGAVRIAEDPETNGLFGELEI